VSTSHRQLVQYAITELPFASVSKLVLRNHSYEDEFRIQIRFHANQTYFRCKTERFYTKTRFETEAQGKSEMAYFSHLTPRKYQTELSINYFYQFCYHSYWFSDQILISETNLSYCLNNFSEQALQQCTCLAFSWESSQFGLRTAGILYTRSLVITNNTHIHTCTFLMRQVWIWQP